MRPIPEIKIELFLFLSKQIIKRVNVSNTQFLLGLYEISRGCVFFI